MTLSGHSICIWRGGEKESRGGGWIGIEKKNRKCSLTGIVLMVVCGQGFGRYRWTCECINCERVWGRGALPLAVVTQSHLKLCFFKSSLQDKSSLSFFFFFHPVQQTIICSGSFSRAHRIAPVQIQHADTNQTNDCMQIRVSVEEKN